MISFRKQMFGLFLSIGLFVVVLLSGFMNTTIHREFDKYVATSVDYVGRYIADKIFVNYKDDITIIELIENDIVVELRSGRCAISVLDKNKNFLLGVTKEDLINEIYNNTEDRYDFSIEALRSFEYLEVDIPILNQYNDEIVAFVRTGYFPKLLMAIEDIEFSERINSSIVLTALISFISALIFSVTLSKHISKPIYDIVDTSVELSQGNYSARYYGNSKIKEIQTLSSSINNLARQLEEEDAIRKKLISDVSHEIRTPLHVLQSNLEAMIDGIYPTDEEQMQALHKEVVRFSNLLSNLDKLKNVEEPQKELNLIDIHLNSELEEIYRTFKVVALEKKLEYTISIEKSKNIHVNIDPDAFRQIFMNLLSNAFKFTSEGKIEIETELKGKNIIIKIKDTGIGISYEDQKYIFDRMYRGDKSRELYEGSGIGLTIVKKLILQLNGEIYAISKVGEGTTMRIELPVASVNKTKRF